MSGLKHTLEVIEETIEKGLEAVHLKKKEEDAHNENGTVSAETEAHLKKKEDNGGDGRGYSVETENLAMPEIHTGKVDTEPEKKDHKVSGISYDNLAMPEVHFKKK